MMASASEPGDAVVEGHAERPKLRFVSARAQPEDQAPPAHLVQGIGQLGEQRRVA